MRRRLTTALLATLLGAPSASAQVLEQTMVPAGQLRLQAHTSFSSWDSRFGRLPDGTERLETLGEDLTDPTALTLFPGMPTLSSAVASITGGGPYTPVLGSTSGLITQDITQVDWGGQLGIFDWLNIGVVLPWIKNRTAVESFFLPDSINGDLGLNPTVTDRTSVDAFLGASGAADAVARAQAESLCGMGAGPQCDAAQALAGRVSTFDSSVRAAYGATPFFPLVGSAAATALEQSTTTLSADLIAAGLSGFTLPMAFATDPLLTEDFTSLSTMVGGGIEATALQGRSGLWAAGDVEVSARVRLLDNLTPREGEADPTFGYTVIAGFLARLPTGTPGDPDVLLDLGTGDAQMDLEGNLAVSVTLWGRLGLAFGGRYGTQGSTTVTRRVAAPEVVMPPLSTRQALTWQPGFYMALEAAPSLYIAPGLSLTGDYRFLHKGRDEFALLNPNPSLDPLVLSLESGYKLYQIGGGIRYDSVGRWLRGEGRKPMELHLRVLHTFRGGGGQAPALTRVEAGVRLFKQFWGPRRP